MSMSEAARICIGASAGLWTVQLTRQASPNEAFCAYTVDYQAIVIPETIDAIRALTEVAGDAAASIRHTNKALGIPWQLARVPDTCRWMP